MRILLAEDERALSRALTKIFEKNNYSADAVYNGEDAVSYLESGNYDLLILDVMMPGMDGFTALRLLRSLGNNIPVLMLTARSGVDEKVKGLDGGANDYLTKPFDTKELLARVRALTRGTASANSVLTLGNLSLDRTNFRLSTPDGSIRLANREFQMMELFLSYPQQVFSTERFLEKIWGFDTDTEINVVWVYISYLRKKLASLKANVEIKAHRGTGYSLEEKTE